MPRLLGVDIPNDRPTVISLTYLYGVGSKTARELCHKAGVNPQAHARELGEDEVARIAALLDKDYVVEGQLRRQVDITTALYSSVQQDLERARADEVRDTPVMTITATPYPPIKKSWPARTLLAGIAFVLVFGLHLTRDHWLPALRGLRSSLDAPRE